MPTLNFVSSERHSAPGLPFTKLLKALNEIPLTQTDLKSKLLSLLIGRPQPGAKIRPPG
jgi:hypothetical protein